MPSSPTPPPEGPRPFLGLVAEDLVARAGDDLAGLTVVLPNRRAGVFLNQHLGQHIGRPAWAPTLTTVNDLMVRASGLRVDDPISLVFRLFDIYRAIRGDQEPIERFYFWGQVMLADFDQVDRYMVDARQLYANIRDVKDIETRFAHLTGEQEQALRDYLGVMAQGAGSSPLRESYLSVWGILGEVYERFRESLLGQGRCYEGMAYRLTAQRLSGTSPIEGMPPRVAFVGFNALTPSEGKLFDYYRRRGDALFYWDCHPYLIAGPGLEAGQYIREGMARYGQGLGGDPFPAPGAFPPSVTVVAAPSLVTQAKLIPHVLALLEQDGVQLDQRTAIVFASEGILIPAIQSLPESLGQANITMAYPLRDTPAYNLAEVLVRLQMNARPNDTFYHREVLAVLNHPYIRRCEPGAAFDLVAHIKTHNRIYPAAAELARTELLRRVFARVDPQGLCPYIMAICAEVARAFASAPGPDGHSAEAVELEFLLSLHKCLNRIHGVLAEWQQELSHRVFLSMLRQALNQERVSFVGEPLAGVQLMGFLETRTLDFENLVILSCNDDILPGQSRAASFITPSLRAAFGLPDHRHREAIYAYYFYRLLPRAKRVYLLYSARTEGLVSGERSRFALQLQMEHMVGRVHEVQVRYPMGISPSLPISIPKGPEVIASLLQRMGRGGQGYTLSPSALIQYLSCPLRFYFRYCAAIGDTDELAEEVGALEFGRIIHSTLEALYAPYRDALVDRRAVEGLLNNPRQLEQALDRAFAQIFLRARVTPDADHLSGRNALARHAMLYTIKRMLEVDRERAPFHLLGHEVEVYIPLPIQQPNAPGPIRLGGVVDRLERDQRGYTVIDYKTGRADERKGGFESIGQLFDDKRIDSCKEVFQIFCYSLALMHAQPGQAIRPALWFAKILQPGQQPCVRRKEGRDYLELLDFTPLAMEFRQGLERLLADIFDPQLPFHQTPDDRRCRTCPYAPICQRGQAG